MFPSLDSIERSFFLTKGFFPHWAHADSSFVGVSVVSWLLFGRGQKNRLNRAPMSNFHSLSTYVDHTNYKSYFPRQLGHSYFVFPHVFYDFFHWNSLGPVEILNGLGGTKMSVFHSLSNLLFNWIPFHKIGSYTKLTQCILTRMELRIPNHFSSSLSLICTQIYSFSKSEMSKNH